MLHPLCQWCTSPLRVRPPGQQSLFAGPSLPASDPHSNSLPSTSCHTLLPCPPTPPSICWACTFLARWAPSLCQTGALPLPGKHLPSPPSLCQAGAPYHALPRPGRHANDGCPQLRPCTLCLRACSLIGP